MIGAINVTLDSVEEKSFRCSSCKTVFFAGEVGKCTSCSHPVDSTDEVMWGEDGLTSNNSGKMAELDKFEAWGCDTCGGINANKPKKYNEIADGVINCEGCGNKFDIKNFVSPFWATNDLTFTEDTVNREEFSQTYNAALNLSKELQDSEKFIEDYKKLLKEIKSENMFKRDDKMENIYDFLVNYVKLNSPEKEQKASERILENQEGNKKIVNILLNWKTVGSAGSLISLVVLYNLAAPTYEEIEISQHNWKMVTPMEKFQHERFEIFDVKGSKPYELYIERSRDKKLDVIFLGKGGLHNGTYTEVNDGPEIERNVPGSGRWIYKSVTKKVDDPSKPIKETSTNRVCEDKYKTVQGERKKTINLNEDGKVKTYTQTETYKKRVKDGEKCDDVTTTRIVGYKQKKVTERVKDHKKFDREMFQPKKDIPNMDPSIIYKAKTWQEVSPYVTQGSGLNPVVSYKTKVDERLDIESSKTTYAVKVIITKDDGEKIPTIVKIKGEDDWKKLRNGLECEVKVGNSNKISENNILEGCFGEDGE